MKRGGPTHPKVKRLAASLHVSLPTAVGLLELLWHFTAVHAVRGNVGYWSNEEIADAIQWDGGSEKLIKALVGSGLLDEHPVHRLLVHDWPQHCDEAVRKQIKRRKLVFAQAEPACEQERESRPMISRGRFDDSSAPSAPLR